MLGRRSRGLVGLDIGSSAVKVVEIRRDGGPLRVMSVGVEPLPVVMNEVIGRKRVMSDAIRRIFAARGITVRHVAVALSGHAVMVKKLTFPAMPDDELRSSIQWEARRHIPFDSKDVNLDFQVVDDASGSARGSNVEVLLVAARRQSVEDRMAVVAQAGCVPHVVDLDGFALQNAHEANCDPQPDRVTVLVNAGASLTNINVVRGSQSIFMRDVALGGVAYREALQTELALDLADAELVKRGGHVKGTSPEDVEPVIEAVTQRLLHEVGRALDFFRSTRSTDQIHGIVLTGGTSRVAGLRDAMADRFETDVEFFDPFKRIYLDPRVVSADERAELAPVCAVAVGLALRQMDD